MLKKRDSIQSQKDSKSQSHSKVQSHSRKLSRSPPQSRTRSRMNRYRYRTPWSHSKHYQKDRFPYSLRLRNIEHILDKILYRVKAIEYNLMRRHENTDKGNAVDSMIPRSQYYYVSNFDPSIHNIDAWCDEVDRARIYYNWGDRECFSWIEGCLKGYARSWLNEWTNERSWSNFKLDFKSVLPKGLDYADILYDILDTSSENYASFSEYAHRTLFRLRSIKGISDELMTLIIIRGINDIQVQEAAIKSNLNTDTIVPFLSYYVKPYKYDPFHKRNCIANRKCICTQVKHGDYIRNLSSQNLFCTFCKRKGHTRDICFGRINSMSKQSNCVTIIRIDESGRDGGQ